MKSIKENWEAFAEPMKQELKNLTHIKENISDTIADKMDEIHSDSANKEISEDQTQEKKGCLKGFLVYGFIILAILAFFKNGCSFNSKIERDTVGEKTTQAQSNTPTDNQSLYENCIQISESTIAILVTQNPIDTDKLEEEYTFLLTCMVSEYMFKSMAYGHFTEKYETTQYDYILKKCSEFIEKMKKYIDAEMADSIYTTISVDAYTSFDDDVFNYDSCLVGTAKKPDIDAMWENYFASLVGAVD